MRGYRGSAGMKATVICGWDGISALRLGACLLHAMNSQVPSNDRTAKKGCRKIGYIGCRTSFMASNARLQRQCRNEGDSDLWVGWNLCFTSGSMFAARNELPGAQ